MIFTFTSSNFFNSESSILIHFSISVFLGSEVLLLLLFSSLSSSSLSSKKSSSSSLSESSSASALDNACYTAAWKAFSDKSV